MNRRLIDNALLRSAALLSVLALLSACATIRPQYDTPQYGDAHFTAYVVNDTQGDFSRFAPIFISERTDQPFNRIGKPRARIDDNDEAVIEVDPVEAVVFVDRQNFTTANGSYTNLIYRIHFEKTPFSLLPFHITAGKNNGLLAVVTLDASNRPVLLTTVHTCGCFLAFTPTTLMPESAYPDGWSTDPQRVYGMTLPGLLELSEPFDDQQRFTIFLKEETHRVMDIEVQTLEQIKRHNPVTPLSIAPVADLMTLPLGDDGSTTPFFETSGSRQGYVKGSYKPFERLLISWWSFDWRVGEDKAFGDKSETGTVFYTSLKPWNRQSSDMWPFAEFLEFWEWGL